VLTTGFDSCSGEGGLRVEEVRSRWCEEDEDGIEG
jgi:hypothetical protein